MFLYTNDLILLENSFLEDFSQPNCDNNQSYISTDVAISSQCIKELSTNNKAAVFTTTTSLNKLDRFKSKYKI